VEGSNPWPNLRYYIGICLEGLRNAKKNISQDSQSLDWDLNLGPPKYEAGGLTMTFGQKISKHCTFAILEIYEKMQ
jgi:hypothetical protein